MSDEHKSAELVKIGEENGWQTQVVPQIPDDFDDDPDANRIEWHFYAKRGDETLHVVYRGERMLENNVYTFGSYRRYPQRRVAIVGFLTGKPNLAKNKNAEPTQLLENRTVEWAPDTPAVEVLLAVLGKRIEYVRRLDGELVTDVHVPRESNLGNKYFRVYEHRNGRYLEFLNYEGFHTVALDTIVNVA